MNREKIKLLRSKAAAATPGPWFAHGDEGFIGVDSHEATIVATDTHEYCNMNGVRSRADAEYIAEADPTAILKLIKDLGELRKSLKSTKNELRLYKRVLRELLGKHSALLVKTLGEESDTKWKGYI